LRWAQTPIVRVDGYGWHGNPSSNSRRHATRFSQPEISSAYSSSAPLGENSPAPIARLEIGEIALIVGKVLCILTPQSVFVRRPDKVQQFTVYAGNLGVLGVVYVTA
jgi:hypothetical protein